MYDWMTVGEILGFAASFYERWSADEERALLERFHLARDQKVGALSRGYRALLSLVLAMAHQPDLVLLDECTSGMDAIARREFERCVIDALQTKGRTVLFAGHQIDEMERICDWVGIIHGGRMLLEMPLETLKASVKLLRIALDGPEAPPLPGCAILARSGAGRETALTVRLDEPDALPKMQEGASLLEVVPLTLEEIFVAVVEAEENK
jgi:ABC-2 type transport system ATP-binding protein